MGRRIADPNGKNRKNDKCPNNNERGFSDATFCFFRGGSPAFRCWVAGRQSRRPLRNGALMRRAVGDAGPYKMCRASTRQKAMDLASRQGAAAQAYKMVPSKFDGCYGGIAAEIGAKNMPPACFLNAPTKPFLSSRRSCPCTYGRFRRCTPCGRRGCPPAGDQRHGRSPPRRRAAP